MIEEKQMQVIIILGMHRSGTSCLTGCLQQLGLQLGKVSDFNDYNLKGNKEDDSIAILNEKILNYNSGSWRNPPKKIEWNQEHEIMGDKILNIYNELPCPVGFKDPRMIFTLPFWQKKIPNIKLLGSFRHPLNVAQSLYNRKNIRIEVEQGLKLWESYNSKLLHLQNQYGFDLIDFDLDKQDYLAQIINTANKLNLNNKSKALDFFDNSLRNQNISDIDVTKCPENILALYNELRSINKDSSINQNNIFPHKDR